MPRTTARTPDSTLAALFPSPAMARLVVFFALHPGARIHLRELERRTGLATSSLQQELKRLTRLGALNRAKEGGRIVYTADEGHDAWRGWRLLIRACADPADVLREAFTGVAGIDAAFVYGSRARGDALPDSDVDLFIVGEPAATKRLRGPLSEAESLLGQELDVIEYTPEQLAERARSGNAFVARVLEGRKRWLAGTPATLEQTGAR
jgi:predicted nucleotidyltransferase